MSNKTACLELIHLWLSAYCRRYKTGRRISLEVYFQHLQMYSKFIFDSKWRVVGGWITQLVAKQGLETELVSSQYIPVPRINLKQV